jgi:uncharacterized RDD family membrane protein YckC
MPAAAVTPYAAAPGFGMQVYGGFWIRLVALLVDRLVIGAVAVPIFVVMVLPALVKLIHDAQINNEPRPELIASMVGASVFYGVTVFCGQWLYEALMTSSSWQATLGKRLLHLIVVDEQGNRISFGRATGRFFAKILSSLILNIGFIMVAFTDRKQGLHDMLAHTLVKRM